MDQTIKARLQRIFNSGSVTFGRGTWFIEEPGDFPASRLIEAAGILGCLPEQLFTSFDVQDESGCETCGSDIVKTLELRVRS